MVEDLEAIDWNLRDEESASRRAGCGMTLTVVEKK